MNKHRLVLGSMLAGLLLVFGYIGITHAQSFKTGDNVTVTQNEKVDGTLYAAGKNLDINSEVFGDIFCAGQTITISGTVHGDVICAGQTIRVSGKVDGDVRLAGQTVSVDAEVTGNATIGSQTFTLDSNGKILGDTTLGTQDAALNGTIGRDLVVGGGTVNVAGKIGRNIKGNVQNLNLASSAAVGGNIDYTSANDLTQATGAKVAGQISRTNPPQHTDTSKGAFFGLGLGFFVYALAAMLVASMILALLFPRILLTVTNHSIPRPWKALLIGFLAQIAAPVIFIVLLITVVGIPLAILFILAWLVLVMLSGPVTAFYLGRLMLRNQSNVLLYMLAGSALLIVLYFIPIVGIIALVFAAWNGTGMLLMELFHRTPRPAYTHIEVHDANEAQRKR